MTGQFLRCLVFVLSFAVYLPIAAADDAKDDAIAKDRQRIEGTWRIVELVVNGHRSSEEDARKLTVVNGDDGTWILRSQREEIVRGSSTFDPTKTPKTIDFKPTTGDAKDKLHLGIYELGENTRKLCFAPAGADRPAAFKSEPGSGHVFVVFERVK